MGIRHFSLALILWSPTVVALTGFGQPTITAQITFVQASQNRNQSQTQDQNQRGLPPEKKRSLSRYGPEDAFPGANQQEESRKQSAGSKQRSQRSSASRTTPRQSPTPATTPAMTVVTTPSPAIAQAATPSPTMIVALSNQFQPLPSAPRPSSSASPWAVPVLSGLALIVCVALIYVLTKLIEKIREDSHI